MHLKKLLLSIAILLTGSVFAQTYVSPTHYNWTQVAQQITAGATSKMDQAYKIYRWLCDNIAYDTTYSIYTADEAWDNRRGVCQAYSELFYRLGEPIGLKVDVIVGKAKGLKGDIDAHAWVFVYTGENKGILVDPTWGAGSVNNGKFTRNEQDDSWFRVNPYWMLFSHFPDDSSYQLIPDKIDYATFASLPGYRPAYAEFLQDGHALFNQCLSGKRPELPDYYPSLLSYVTINNLPTERTLRVGQYYDFALKGEENVEIAIANENSWFYDWQQIQGYSVCRYTPAESGTLSICVKRPGEKWHVLVEYQVARPTATDIANIEAAEPWRSPALQNVENFYPDKLKQYVANPTDMLAHVKAERIKRLPILYKSPAEYIINDIPWNGELSVGQSYTFQISPYEGIAWAIINEDDWYQEWHQDPETLVWIMTVTPRKQGKLGLAVQMGQGESYNYCFMYTVK